MTTFYVNPLSNKSIQDTLLKVKNYKESLKSFPKVYADAIEAKMNEILNGQAPPMAKGLWSSYVRVSSGGFGGDSEFGEGGSNGGAEAVFVFNGNVEFIEFGTGIIGKKYHGGINTDWLKKLPGPYTEYNMGPTIVHFQDDEDMDYWVYKDEQGIHRTHGIPADPFIYRSVQELMRMHADLARNVFKSNNIGNDIEIWE